jgi:hypothetical protein
MRRRSNSGNVLDHTFEAIVKSDCRASFTREHVSVPTGGAHPFAARIPIDARSVLRGNKEQRSSLGDEPPESQHNALNRTGPENNETNAQFENSIEENLAHF